MEVDKISDTDINAQTPKRTKTAKPKKINFSEKEGSNNEGDQSNDNQNRKINWSKYNDILLSGSNDTQFGVRKVRDNLKIGNFIVKFHKSTLKIRSTSFPITTGLLDLLYYKKPPESYTKADLQQYKEILILTNAHKKIFDANNSPRKLQKSYKYKHIISPIFKSGGGIEPKYMSVTSNKIDYTYWDNPNELVERLKLLVSSSSAGHTGHNNEIISIIEELREASLIE